MLGDFEGEVSYVIPVDGHLDEMISTLSRLKGEDEFQLPHPVLEACLHARETLALAIWINEVDDDGKLARFVIIEGRANDEGADNTYDLGRQINLTGDALVEPSESPPQAESATPDQDT